MIYEDDSIALRTCQDGSIEAAAKVLPSNPSYMEAKLAEYIGNQYGGAWCVPVGSKKVRGMKSFSMEWVDDKLIARWI